MIREGTDDRRRENRKSLQLRTQELSCVSTLRRMDATLANANKRYTAVSPERREGDKKREGR